MALAAGVLGLLAPLGRPAQAVIPKAERVARAAAEVNVAASRTQALRLEVQLRIEDEEPAAIGELVTHPSGLARLELRGANRLVERHLLRGAEHLASRNGRFLERARSFLPPLFVLQADSELTLRAALRAYRVQVDAIALAPCGESDCFVVGDGRRAPPPAPGTETRTGKDLSPTDAAADGSAAGSGTEASGAPALPGEPDSELRWVFAEPQALPPEQEGRELPKVWIDIRRYEVLRIDFADGVRVRFGPTASFNGVHFPLWIGIEEPDHRPVRLEVLRVAPVSAAPAAAFGTAWLLEAREQILEQPADPSTPPL